MTYKTYWTLYALWVILFLAMVVVLTPLGDTISAFASGAPGDFPWEDVFPSDIAEVMYEISHDFEVARDYFITVREDGDYLNDWLTHLPCPFLFKQIGRLLAERTN